MFKKTLVILFAALFLLGVATPSAHALYGLKKFWIEIVDENGKTVTDTATVGVYTIDTTTAATVYSDENATSLTNPGTTATGVFEWWSATTSFDVKVNVGARGSQYSDVTVNLHRIVLQTQIRDEVVNQKIVPLPLGVWYDSTGGDVIDYRYL